MYYCSEGKPRTVRIFGNRSVIKPKQTGDRAGGGCETNVKQIRAFFGVVVICLCLISVMAEVRLKS